MWLVGSLDLVSFSFYLVPLFHAAYPYLHELQALRAEDGRHLLVHIAVLQLDELE